MAVPRSDHPSRLGNIAPYASPHGCDGADAARRNGLGNGWLSRHVGANGAAHLRPLSPGLYEERCAADFGHRGRTHRFPKYFTDFEKIFGIGANPLKTCGGGGSRLRTGLPSPFTALREICRENRRLSVSARPSLGVSVPQASDSLFVSNINDLHATHRSCYVMIRLAADFLREQFADSPRPMSGRITFRDRPISW